MMDEKYVIPEININDRFMVKKQDGLSYNAYIIETRTTEMGSVEYFVHYHGSDRRLDEWVDVSRIDLTTKGNKPSGSHGVLPDNLDSRLTRNQKRKYDELNHVPTDLENMDSMTQKLEKEHQEFTRVKYIEEIQLGKYEIQAWYFSPYPEEYRRLTKLWICEFCLKYMRLEKSYLYHLGQCRQRRPPGKEIYRKGNICVFELDGSDHKLYCQNLCLLAKLFLDHKTLYYDVAPFMFYVLCEVDKQGCHVVGYFSKEKISTENNNLACILTLPPFQRKGYGKFLIAFSYELAKIENMIGSPEKPLSDLGRLSYRSYWEFVIFSYLADHPNVMDATVDRISQATCIAQDDIMSVLQHHQLVKYYRLGTHVAVCQKELVDYLTQHQSKRPRQVDTSRLLWGAPTKTHAPKVNKK